MKCDETFPACRQCQRLGRVCDGYGIWGGGGVNLETKPSSLPPRHALVPYTNVLRSGPTANPGLQISSEEQLYLEWFIHGTSTSSPRVFNSIFWDPAILQATAHEPMILQALLALSASHKRHVLDPINRVMEAPDALEIFILKHYGSAINGLKKHLDGHQKVPRSKWFAAVTMCTLMVMLALMRGRFEEAFVHLDTGARIFEQYAQDPDEQHPSPTLARFFVRLLDQTSLFRRAMSSQQAQASTTVTLTMRFSSPVEAEQCLDDIVEQLAYLAQQKRALPPSAIAAIAMQRKVSLYLLACFDSWLSAYNKSTEEQRSTLTPGNLAAYEALLQYHTISRELAEKC